MLKIEKVESYTGVDAQPLHSGITSHKFMFLTFRETQSITQNVYGCIDTYI